jgi:hypothetical protein
MENCSGRDQKGDMMLLFIKQLFCDHKNQILGERALFDDKEIFCDNCKKVLIKSWLYAKIEKAIRRRYEKVI